MRWATPRANSSVTLDSGRWLGTTMPTVRALILGSSMGRHTTSPLEISSRNASFEKNAASGDDQAL